MTTPRRLRQRTIRPEHKTDPALLRAPHAARLTAQELWMAVDDFGRMDADPYVVAVSCYPGEAVPLGMIEEHLLELAETGFLSLYSAAGREWLQLTHPLMSQRPTASLCPPPPGRSGAPEDSGNFMAVERERAGARAREPWGREPSGPGEPQESWEAWRAQASQLPRPPRRPVLVGAPPIGCPDHPRGNFAACGPCGTAREQRAQWIAEQRYRAQVEDYEEQVHAASSHPVFRDEGQRFDDEPSAPGIWVEGSWADGR